MGHSQHSRRWTSASVSTPGCAILRSSQRLDCGLNSPSVVNGGLLRSKPTKLLRGSEMSLRATAQSRCMRSVSPLPASKNLHRGERLVLRLRAEFQLRLFHGSPKTLGVGRTAQSAVEQRRARGRKPLHRWHVNSGPRFRVTLELNQGEALGKGVTFLARSGVAVKRSAQYSRNGSCPCAGSRGCKENADNGAAQPSGSSQPLW